MSRRLAPLSVAALLLLLAAFAVPVGRSESGGTAYWTGSGAFAVVGLGVAALCAAWSAVQRPRGLVAGLALAVGVAAGAVAPLYLLTAGLTLGTDAPGLWLVIAGLLCLAWRTLEVLSATPANRFVHNMLLPSPSQIGHVIAASLDVLAQDFRQTFLKSVLAGFLLGSGSGFLAAILIDRSPFLQRGLLPLGALVSAIPIVGIAPIMVMWFGFDWQSKAAVIVVMTFFPMLVNALTGLNAAGDMERDLMRSYAAGYWQTLLRLRLPNALPFIFNALKINSTLALIGAIVAEFFGTPIVGMGFRISTEVGRMNIEMVWATIAVAALAGSLFYAALALAERALTFWHPSYRQ
jgi:NitT/TauT family transport system permease protein